MNVGEDGGWAAGTGHWGGQLGGGPRGQATRGGQNARGWAAREGGQGAQRRAGRAGPTLEHNAPSSRYGDLMRVPSGRGWRGSFG